MNIIVKNNTLWFDGKTYQCAVGKSGFTHEKIEGDNKTPIGKFPLREVFYRSDKVAKPASILSTHITTPDDGWCDAPGDKNYNRRIKLPYPVSHENLWRADDIYDVIVPMGYNDQPVIPGKGSAIFMHVARPGYAGTEGCVALALPDLLEVLSKIDNTTEIIIES